tara:strand:+ start:18 stop:1757 length:1740 start_codon:yes stop_codon:yes gene_type:complete
MNKNIIYLSLAVIIGLLLGWLLFGGNGEDSNMTKAETELSGSHDHSEETIAQQWTCSMHPQIMQPEPGDCPICGMDLIPAESGSEGLSMNEIKMTQNAMALANIQTTVVGSGLTSKEDGTLILSGKIAANEENNSVQASYFEGRIEQLNVNYDGQKVNRGQLLATIYAPTLVAAQQELITASAIKESQPALYTAVRNKLKNWKLSENQINAIESSGNVRDNFPIYATVSGTVSEVMAREGDYVKQGQPLLKVSNLNSVWAEFDAYENQISDLRKGQKIKVITNAYPNEVFNATVSFIDPILDDATRTVTVRATLPNRDGIFKPGMFVTAEFEGTAQMNSEIISIPASAVLWTGERSLVYVKTNPNEPVFEMRKVLVGKRNGESYSITEGLKSGEEIVTNGTFTVDAAAQLQGKKSMMNKGKKENTEERTEMKVELPGAVQNKLKESLDSYFNMKNAFVESDPVQVSMFAKALLKEIELIDLNNLGSMEISHFREILNMLEAISTNDNIENQRAHFVILNENIVPLTLPISTMEEKIYLQRCPMANNNKGAFWLSREKEIRNPYFGDAMLSCGEVKEIID